MVLSFRFLEIWIKVWFVNKLFNSPATASNLLCVRDHKRFRIATMNATRKKRKSPRSFSPTPRFSIPFSRPVPRAQLSRRTCIQREVIKMESGRHLHVYSTSLIPTALSSLRPPWWRFTRNHTHAEKYTGRYSLLSPLKPESCSRR